MVMIRKAPGKIEMTIDLVFKRDIDCPCGCGGSKTVDETIHVKTVEEAIGFIRRAMMADLYSEIVILR